MTHIALFGTSADPPTTAHQKILDWLSRRFDWVAVWASDNPFKSHQTPLEHRAAMLQLLIDDIDPPRHNLQLQQELSSPRAMITVEKARTYWTDAEFTLVIGGDLVSQLPRWYRVEELLQQVKLLVVPRPGYPLVEAELNHLREMGARVAIANLRGPKLSSTDYREQKDANVLTPPIEEYIHRERLYECHQDVAPKRLMLPSPSGH
jgi:nicotinate-nucleotide adenylyltransferase